MSALIVLVLALSAVVTLSYLRVKPVIAAATLAVLSLLSFLLDAAEPLSVALLALAVVLGLLGVEGFRKPALSGWLFKWFQRAWPPLSAAERETLEAGGAWWEERLFSGEPDWERLLGYNKPRLSEEEQAFLNGPARELCALVDVWDMHHQRAEIPPEIMDYLKQEKFFGMGIPKAYGGLELSAVARTEALTRLAAAGGVALHWILAANALGPGELLLKYGTEEQKSRYLPRLATGEEIPCFAPAAPGVDAAAVTDRAVVCKGEWQGRETLGMRLSFDKSDVALAPVATLIGLAFQLSDPQHLLGETDDCGVACALVPRDAPGVEAGARHLPVGGPWLSGPLRGREVFVPLENIIGGPEMAGKGRRMLVNCLATGGCVGLPAVVNGVCKHALAATGAYARLRRRRDTPLSRMEGIQKPLARMAGFAYIINAARLQTAVAVDAGFKPAVPAAILKRRCAEMGRAVINDAVDIHAGKAALQGPRNYLAACYEGIPAAVSAGGDLMPRNAAIFRQGALRCHPYLSRAARLAADADEARAAAEFDEVWFGHLGFACANGARGFAHALSASWAVKAPPGSLLRRYYQHGGRFSAALMFASDLALFTLRGSLPRREMIVARLGDLLSDLYLLSMVLKQFADAGNRREDVPLAGWACQHLLHRCQQAMLGLIDNLPNRLFVLALRWTVFPLGPRFKPPADRLHSKVAKLFSADTEIRRRFFDGLFPADSDANAIGKLNALLRQADIMDILRKELRQAIAAGRLPEKAGAERIAAARQAGIISGDEADKLREFEEQVAEIMRVDEFPFASFRRDGSGAGSVSGMAPAADAAMEPFVELAPDDAPHDAFNDIIDNNREDDRERG